MNISRTRWRLLSLLAALSLCAVLVQAATASPGQRPQTADVSYAPALAGNISGAQEALKVAYSGTAVKTTSTTFFTVPGAVLGLTIPSGHTDLLLMRFTGESYCSGSVNGYCLLRILVDTTEAKPTAQNSYAFDSRSSEGSESHAVERSLCVGPGTHTVQVQFSTTSSAITFGLDDWHLSVERSHGCS